MKRFLVVVDMQRDFVDGSLGTAEAQAIVPPVAEKIRSFDGTVFATLDTHGANYLETSEGRHLPVAHCIKGTPGWQLNADVAAALEGKHAVVLIGAGRAHPSGGGRRGFFRGADRSLHGHLRRLQRAAAQGEFL